MPAAVATASIVTEPGASASAKSASAAARTRATGTGGRPRRTEGRDAIAARLRAVFDADTGRLRFGSFDNARVREAGDEVIIEGDGHHRTADGTPVEISCVWFITRRDGQVTHFRDYMNPVPLTTHKLMRPS